MIQVAMNRTHGEEARFFPHLVAKVQIVGGGPAPKMASYWTYPSRIHRVKVGAFESPPNAKIEFTSAMSADSIQKLAKVCKGTWTSPDIKDGVLDDTVTVGSTVEMTLSEFKLTQSLTLEEIECNPYLDGWLSIRGER